MNEYCLLKRFTAGPYETCDGVKTINEEVFSEGTLTFRVVRMSENDAGMPSTGPGAVVSPVSLVISRREEDKGCSWPGEKDVGRWAGARSLGVWLEPGAQTVVPWQHLGAFGKCLSQIDLISLMLGVHSCFLLSVEGLSP